MRISVGVQNFCNVIMVDRTHIVLHRSIPELRGNHFQDFPPNPPFLGHCGIRVPIWRYLFEPFSRLGLVSFVFVGHECRSYETIHRLPKLLLRRRWDNWTMHDESPCDVAKPCRWRYSHAILLGLLGNKFLYELGYVTCLFGSDPSLHVRAIKLTGMYIFADFTRSPATRTSKC